MADKVDPRIGELSTTNYGWVKPTVGASVDAWGGYLNTDLDGIDSTVKSVSNSIPTQITAAINALPVAMNDNRLINGDFAVNQRTYVSGTALATTVYGHDRWKAGPSGCTYTFTAALPDTTITITAGTLTQVIEAGAIASGVYTLSWTGTAQARVYQGAPTGSYAASPVTTASLTAGTNTIVEFNAGTLVRVKFEIGSVATPFNRQSLAKSMADCQRYYQSSAFHINAYTAAGSAIYASFFLPVVMRAVPTVVFIGQTYTNASGLSVNDLTTTMFTGQASVTATGNGFCGAAVAFSAEL